MQEDVPAGSKVMEDPYVTYSFFEIIFPLKVGTKSWYKRDLGLGITQNGTNIECEFEAGLISYKGYPPVCTLFLGPAGVPASLDYAFVRITNYSSIISAVTGVQVIFNIPLYQVQGRNSFPNSIISLFKMIQNSLRSH